MKTKVREIVKKHLVEDKKGHTMLDGKWYSFKFGCDGLMWIIQDFDKALADQQAEYRGDVVKVIIKWFSGLKLETMQSTDKDVSDLIKKVQKCL